MKNKFLAKGTALVASIAPVMVSAQVISGGDFFTKFKNFINQSISLLLGVATLIFLLGVVQFVIAGGDEKKIAGAKTFMMYGIIGLVLMVAVWGVVNLLVGTLDLDNQAATLPFSF